MGRLGCFIDWKTSNFVLGDLRDEARALSRYYNYIMAHVYNHSTLVTMTEESKVPVINGLSDIEYPCQALADFMTIQESFCELRDLYLIYIRDLNNIMFAVLWVMVLVNLAYIWRSQRPDFLHTRCYNIKTEVWLLAKSLYRSEWSSNNCRCDLHRYIVEAAGFKIPSEMFGEADSIMFLTMELITLSVFTHTIIVLRKITKEILVEHV